MQPTPAVRPTAMTIAAICLALAALACERAPAPPSAPEPPAAAPTSPTPASPSPSAATPPATRPAVADPADWCGGHGVPESMCTVCNPHLVDGFRAAGDWCEEHGYPESVCPTCNPMAPPERARPGQHGQHDDHAGHGHAAPPATRPVLADPADWCGGHGVPESMCTVCNPHLVDGFRAAGDWCEEHGYPESVCPTCNPMDPPGGARAPSPVAPGTRVRLRAPDIEDAAGIGTTRAQRRALGAELEVTARVDFDRNALADVRSAVPGIVREVAVDLGQPVAAEAALFTLESAHVGDLQAQRGAAREAVDIAEANLERQRALHEGSITSRRQLELAEQELAAAEATLRSIDQSLRISGAARRGSTGRFVVEAPIAGTVVRRPAVVGTYADEATSLATIADTATMWALLDLPEWDAAAVSLGQRVELEVDGVADRTFAGTVTWLASEVDPRTRTVTARAELDNPDGLLRAGQFARARIQLERPEAATTVPAAAVQRVGETAVVFVREEAGVYEPRVVQPLRSRGGVVQLAGDLDEGEEVVTTGAFLLRTELSPDSIGAGCCEVEGPRGE